MQAVRNLSMLPGPKHVWSAQWVGLRPGVICEADVAVWPFSVFLLVKIGAFLGTLHWPAEAGDFGGGGVSYVELLIMYELWQVSGLYWRSLFLGVGVGGAKFQCRLFLWVQELIFGVRVASLVICLELWAHCLVGMKGFFPCQVGGDHCRLRHICWVKSEHGLTSRPKETSSAPCLDELLTLFRYPS